MEAVATFQYNLLIKEGPFHNKQLGYNQQSHVGGKDKAAEAMFSNKS